jgi:hypothetical protein
MFQPVAENSTFSFSVGLTVGVLLGAAAIFGIVLFGEGSLGRRLRRYILDD